MSRRSPVRAPIDVNTTTGAEKEIRTRPRVTFISGASMGATAVRQTADPGGVVNTFPPNHQLRLRFHAGRCLRSMRGIPLTVSLDMVRPTFAPKSALGSQFDKIDDHGVEVARTARASGSPRHSAAGATGRAASTGGRSKRP